VDDTGRPVEVPQIIPETEKKQRFEAALRRKQLSLVLAETQPSDTTELKALFINTLLTCNFNLKYFKEENFD
jgi:hypothetical protein